MGIAHVKLFQGDDGAWGILEDGGVLYEAEFARITAEAMVDMYNSENPPKDWEETAHRLTAIGLQFEPQLSINLPFKLSVD